jgi:hypothetical protein
MTAVAYLKVLFWHSHGTGEIAKYLIQNSHILAEICIVYFAKRGLELPLCQDAGSHSGRK